MQVVSLTHQMEQQFLGVAIGDLSHILQLRVLAQSAQLLVLLATNLAGMKQSCIQYLQLLNNFERYNLTLCFHVLDLSNIYNIYVVVYEL